MSMPQIPEEKNRPTVCEVTIDILKSVALEETALSHILNADGEKNQAVVKKYECCCDEVTFGEMCESMRQTEKLLTTIIMKEWLLLKKMETALEITKKLGSCKTKKEKDDDCHDCRHKDDCCKENYCKENCHKEEECRRFEDCGSHGHSCGYERCERCGGVRVFENDD